MTLVACASGAKRPIQFYRPAKNMGHKTGKKIFKQSAGEVTCGLVCTILVKLLQERDNEARKIPGKANDRVEVP